MRLITWSRRLLAILALTVLTAGCGRKESAQLGLFLAASAQHPELAASMAQLDLARTLSALDLSPAQATALKTWAANEGASLRQLINDSTTKLAELSPRLDTASRAMLEQRTASLEAQEALLTQVLGEDKARIEAEEPPIDLDAEVSARAVSLREFTDSLNAQQQLVITGDWEKLVKLAGDYLTAEDDDVRDSKRGEIVSLLAQSRGYGWFADDDTTKLIGDNLTRLAGETKDRTAVANGLLAAVPVADEDVVRTTVAETLASLLCLEPAVSLLDIID